MHQPTASQRGRRLPAPLTPPATRPLPHCPLPTDAYPLSSRSRRCKVGACPPGFVSRPDLERHLRSQHCLPDVTAATAPCASLTYMGDATLLASIPFDAAASAASDASAARLSSRQLSLLTAKAKREEEEPLLASRWGQPGVGDGVIDVTVRHVRPISGSHFIVEGTSQDGTLTLDKFTKSQLQVLRRTMPVLPGLDNDVQEGQEQAPAEAQAALMGSCMTPGEPSQ